MNEKTPLKEFCEERLIPDSIQVAFGAYISAEMGKRFKMSENGETVRLMMSRITRDHLQEYWDRFVVDLKDYLSAS